MPHYCPETRQELLDVIAESALVGAVGIFAGSGLSKAVTAGEAPTWYALLQDVAHSVRIPDPYQEPTAIIGRSFPEIASIMVDQLVQRYEREDEYPGEPQEKLRDLASKRIKLEVCRHTGIEPNGPALEQLKGALGKIRPSWVVTTNYDNLIEEALVKSETILPNQVLSIRRDSVPVYHMHGHRLNPNSIVLTQDDYGRLFVDNSYRNTRLSYLFAESLTIMTGYSLGDPNVQTAVNLARSLSQSSPEMMSDHRGKLIFLNWVANVGNDRPYVGRYGEIVLNTNNVLDTFEEIAARCSALQDEWSQIENELSQQINTPNFKEDIITNRQYRRDFLDRMVQLPNSLSNDVTLKAIQTALIDAYGQAREAYGWPYYRYWLEILLDVFERWRLSQIPGPIFDYLASQLASLSRYISPNGRRLTGDSWEATECWETNRDAIVGRQELRDALLNYAEQQRERRLREMLT